MHSAMNVSVFFPKLAVVLYFKVSNLFNFCCAKMTMLF